MSCMLRADGKTFNVDSFLTNCSLEPAKVWRAGEPQFPFSQPHGRIKDTSGISFEVSNADFSELSLQIQDAITFFRTHEGFIVRLTSFPGVERVVADFGVEVSAPVWASFSFPSLLMEAFK